MLYQVLQKAEAKLVSQPVFGEFTDEADISEYAAQAVTYGQQTQLIKGMGNGAFVPRGTATRGEAVVLLNRVLEAMIK
ncbi:hypothetical protein D3C72_2379470 [compost metagenome]